MDTTPERHEDKGQCKETLKGEDSICIWNISSIISKQNILYYCYVVFSFAVYYPRKDSSSIWGLYCTLIDLQRVGGPKEFSPQKKFQDYVEHIN